MSPEGRWQPSSNEPSKAEQPAFADNEIAAARPTLGVIIPTVGERIELKRMVVTILDQTRPVHAIRIVVDADDTALVDSIVADLGDRLSAVDLKVISTGATRGEGVYLVETGYGYAVNRGLERLDTELFAFLDDDDELRPRHFEQLEAALDPANGVGAAYSRVEVITPDGETRRFPEGPLPSGRIGTAVLIDRHPVLLPATLIHRSVMDELVSLDESLDRLADTDMLVRLGAATRFAAVDDPTYVYYRQSRKAVVQERVQEERLQMIRKHNHLLTRRERARFWDTESRTSLRAGFEGLGREAAREVVSVIWPNPPEFLVSWYVALRSRRTPEPLRKLAKKVTGPISGKRS
jgi:glycosyltransferase involved in cell wall biosynthesis